MLTELAKVSSISGNQVWVEAVAKTQCQGCSAKTSCGQGLLQRLHPRRNTAIPVKVQRPDLLTGLKAGDAVLVGLEEGLILKLTLLLYCLPLAGLLLGVVVGAALGLTEPWILLWGLLGMFAAVAPARGLSSGRARISRYQPVLLSRQGQPGFYGDNDGQIYQS